MSNLAVTVKPSWLELGWVGRGARGADNGVPGCDERRGSPALVRCGAHDVFVFRRGERPRSRGKLAERMGFPLLRGRPPALPLGC